MEKLSRSGEIIMSVSKTDFEKFYSEYVQMNKGKFDLFELTNNAIKYAMEKCSLNRKDS